MGVIISHLRYIEEGLIARGYVIKRWRHGHLGIRVFAKDDAVVVTIPSIEIPPATIEPLATAVDEYFKRLKKCLEGLAKKVRITDIIFSGGGSIPIPAWFSQ